MLDDWLGRSRDLTTRDPIAGILFVFSGFLCFLLIVAYFPAHEFNHVIFASSFLICSISFAFARKGNRRPMVLALVVFIAIGGVWSLAITALRAL